jgi:apolipoprotein N-acyltransferase
MSKIRPVELGLPLVRVANNGISGIINPFGQEILKSKLNTELHKRILLPSKIKQTFYSKYGNIPFFCLLLFTFMIIYYFNNRINK